MACWPQAVPVKQSDVLLVVLLLAVLLWFLPRKLLHTWRRTHPVPLDAASETGSPVFKEA